MVNEKQQNIDFMTMEEKRLMSVIKNLRENVNIHEGVTFAKDLLEAETRLLLLRRVLDVQRFGAFK
jgi:hypothetical protein